MTTSYAVFVRDTTYNEIAQIDDFETLTLNPRFNDIGAWALSVPLTSPSAALLTSGNGITVYRNGSIFFSGPLGDYHLVGNQDGDTLTVGGADDMVALADRLALPIHGYPYSATILAESNVSRYYRLSSVIDLSSNAVPLTANGAIGSASALIDDTDTSAIFDGSTGFFSSGNATGISTGSHAQTLEGWVYLTAAPASTAVVCCLGNRQTTSAFLVLQITSARVPQFSCTAGAVNGTALSLNTVHHLVGTYDGTTMRLYVDGVQVGTPATTTLALALTNTNKFTVGADTAPTTAGYFSGTIDEVVLYGQALPAANILTHYNLGISRFLASASEASGFGQSGAGIWAYVDVNVGPDAGGTGNGDAARVNAALSIGPMPTVLTAVGSYINASARFDNLLTLIQTMATSGGDIGFRVLQTGTGASNSLTLTIYQPNDKTSNARFSRAIGNLLDYDYEVSRPKANYVYILGAGQGTARKVLELSDSTSITAWNARIEGTVDARDTSDSDTMNARGLAYLDQAKSQVNFSCTAVDTPTCTYGTDYNLGDKVTVYLPDGTTVTDIVREVKITLDRQTGESVSVGIGNPGNGAILTPANAAIRSMLSSHVAVATRVYQLERRW